MAHMLRKSVSFDGSFLHVILHVLKSLLPLQGCMPHHLGDAPPEQRTFQYCTNWRLSHPLTGDRVRSHMKARGSWEHVCTQSSIFAPRAARATHFGFSRCACVVWVADVAERCAIGSSTCQALALVARTRSHSHKLRFTEGLRDRSQQLLP